MAFKLPEEITPSILSRLEILSKQNGVSLVSVISSLGGAKSAAHDWRIGKASPSLAALLKFSEYFGVSLDYLVLGKESDTPIIQGVTGTDEELLRKFHALTPDLQDRLMSYADGLLAAMPQKEDDLGEKLSG